MEILEVGVDEYAEVIKIPYNAFGSAAFNDLNRNKCDKVFYLLFREGKYRLGLVGGCRNKNFSSPFSAPFGGFSFISGDIRLQYIEDAIRLLKTWAVKKRFSSISMILPPPVYESSFNAKQVNCLWRQNFDISEVDLNYSFDLECFDDNYKESIWYNARKNLRISMNAGLQFKTCTNDDERWLAYDIISKNRESRGYPLRMSWQQVSDTIRIIPANFFIVYDELENSIASAIVFHVAQNIVQVIYWGDNHEYANFKTMNFLSYKIFEHYKNQGFQTVDLGSSTENSAPNYGLAEFKESIGCKINPKYTFTKKLH
jgi:hypothetical protein